MMDDLRDLYQEMIIDHSRHPHHFGRIDNCKQHAEGYNPLCGDRITIYLHVENNKIVNASFEGSGCAISTASASMMLDELVGKDLVTVEKVFNDFHGMLTQENNKPELGKLKILAGVKAFPMRVKCATLAWHTLQAALKQQHDTVSTE